MGAEFCQNLQPTLPSKNFQGEILYVKKTWILRCEYYASLWDLFKDDLKKQVKKSGNLLTLVRHAIDRRFKEFIRDNSGG